MLIIVEGTDRSGKSTLVRALRDRLKRLYPGHRVEPLHAGPPNHHPLDEYERPLFSYSPAGSTHIICDRWHVGEQVYPRICGRPTYLTYPVLSHIESFLAARGAIIVHAHAELDVVRHRLDEEIAQRGSVPFTWEQVRDAHHLFFIELKATTLPTVSVDTTADPDLEIHVETIIETALVAEAMAAGIASLRTYVGPLWPDLLLLGDVRHQYRDMKSDTAVARRASDDSSPAFMPYAATSGEYLLRAVDPLALDGRVGFMNANDVDDPHKAWKLLGRPRAVALGRRAYDTVRSWATGAVPHPQFVRRFANYHIDWYRQLIRRAAREGGDLMTERPSGFWSLQETESRR